MVQFNVIGVGGLAPTRPTKVTCINKRLCHQGRGLEEAICICSCLLYIKLEIHWSTIRGRCYIFNLQLLGIESSTNFVYQTNKNHWVTGWLLTRHNNNLKQFWKHWTGAEVLRHWLIIWRAVYISYALHFKCCYNNVIVPWGHWRMEMTSGNFETSLFDTWKRLLGNKCGRVARDYSNCWRLRRLLEAAATAGSCRGLPVKPAMWQKMLFLF